MEGENFVKLKGTILWPELKTVGTNNSKLFKGKLAIPINGRTQYIKIAAWNSVAVGLDEVSDNTFVTVHGHIEEHAYDGACKHCNAAEKRYWTEVVIDNFVQEA